MSLVTGSFRGGPDHEHVSGTVCAICGAEPAGHVRTGATTVYGHITLTRHGKPALSRRCFLNAAQYRDWWARYEAGGLLAGQVPPAELVELAAKVDAIFCSTRLRACETAFAVCQGREVMPDELFIEAPLPPPAWPSWLKMPPRLWGVVSRIHWHFSGPAHGQETRREAEKRAQIAADYLVTQALGGRDVLVLAHGYFNHMIGKALMLRGWHLDRDQGFKYWCQRRFSKG